MGLFGILRVRVAVLRFRSPALARVVNTPSLQKEHLSKKPFEILSLGTHGAWYRSQLLAVQHRAD